MTVMVTRRTLRRTQLLRPDPAVNELFVYCLAVLAQRFDIRVHAALLMSTHEHLIVTDVHGQLPRFLQELHRLLALGIKVLRKWEGAVWDHEKTSVVELRTPAAIIEKLAYVMANPVAAGLVRRASQWPGVTVQPDQLGRCRWSARRPDYYFDDANPHWPAVASLHLSMPPIEAVARELEGLERAAHQEVQTRGRTFMGAKRIPGLSPYDRATSFEALRGRNPTFAVGRGQREAFFHAVAVLREFRRAYRSALEQWRGRVRDCTFPYGTWLMHCVHDVAVALA
jgi:putative transposase